MRGSDLLRGPDAWPGGWLGPTLAVLFVSFAATVGAMRHTSLTFDEVFMIPSSARGFEVGRFDMTRDHPPVTQYLYGLPVHLAGPGYPGDVDGPYNVKRFAYGQQFFFGVGNDPERLAFRARLVAALIALALGLSVFLFVRTRFGGGPAFLAAMLTAFLPDVLAHGGIAYNDVPVALAFFLGVWALDSAARGPGMRTFAVATLVCGLAMGVKLSAMALIPIAVLVFLLEAIRRGNDRAWYGKVLLALPLVPLLGYVVLVLVYLGDPLLTDFRWAFDFNRGHVADGHGYPALLLGERSRNGFWYFFPLGFLLKTPAALHVLGGLAIFGFGRGIRDAAAEGTGRTGRTWAGSVLRAPIVGGLGFLVFLLVANLNIGFRHALPLLPFVALLVAVGVWRLWSTTGRPLRVLLAILVVAHVASSLSYYPWFLSYLSEYVRRSDKEYEVLVDSNLDWGQGLLALREWMEEEGVGRVYLSYFGSALPQGYGIDYVPLDSFLALNERHAPEPFAKPTHVVVSATNLAGTYVSSDRIAAFRTERPVRVLARSLYVYPTSDEVELVTGRR